ncbi:MAG: hypothetical protein ACI36Y_02205, partial [Coriobacteriales bacterium]
VIHLSRIRQRPTETPEEPKKGPDGFEDEDLMDVIRFEITRMPELTELLFSAEREVTSLVCRLSEQAGLD